VIITKFLFANALKVMVPQGRQTFRQFCIDLNKHRLRGFDDARTLYAFQTGFHVA
jgi:hypothetical protein